MLSHSALLYIIEQTCPPVPSALILSMPPHANPFAVPFIHVPRPPADHAIRPFYVAMMSLFPSACSVIHNSHILRFNISDSPSLSFKDNSLYTNKMFFSLKNKPCFLPHKPPLHMTALSRTLTIKSRMSLHKSNNFNVSRLICCKLNVN